jgi:hypothetical protein
MVATMPAPRVFLIMPPREQLTDEKFRQLRRAGESCRELGWKVSEVRAQLVRSVEASEGKRQLRVIEPRDADQIYRAAHDGPTAVLEVLSVRVITNLRAPLSARQSTPLRQFVRYKAHHGTLDNPDAVPELINVLTEMSEFFTCEHDRDARCLPLHVFSTEREWDNLEQEFGQAAFAKQHGSPSKLLDSDGRKWNRTTAYHGYDELRVGELQLPKGFHWDVNSRAAGHMSTHLQVWGFKKGSYANVYPDAAVRVGQRSGLSAQLVFEAARPEKRIRDAAEAPPKSRKSTRSSENRNRRVK